MIESPRMKPPFGPLPTHLVSCPTVPLPVTGTAAPGNAAIRKGCDGTGALVVNIFLLSLRFAGCWAGVLLKLNNTTKTIKVK
jgi:hypothetical protein